MLTLTEAWRNGKTKGTLWDGSQFFARLSGFRRFRVAGIKLPADFEFPQRIVGDKLRILRQKAGCGFGVGSFLRHD